MFVVVFFVVWWVVVFGFGLVCGYLYLCVVVFFFCGICLVVVLSLGCFVLGCFVCVVLFVFFVTSCLILRTAFPACFFWDWM